MRSYKVIVKNNFDDRVSACLFQKMEGQHTIPLALQPQRMKPGTTAEFNFIDNIHLVGGSMDDGVFVKNGIRAINLDEEKYYKVEKGYEGIEFNNMSQPGRKGYISLETNSSLSYHDLIGIGMDKTMTCLFNPMANYRLQFSPKPGFYITASDDIYKGEQLNEQMVRSAAHIVFPENVNTMYATLQEDGKWLISQTA